MFIRNCNIALRNKIAHRHGGALYLIDNTSMQVDGNVAIKFKGNTVIKSEGALYLTKQPVISFREWSVVRFNNTGMVELYIYLFRVNCT